MDTLHCLIRVTSSKWKWIVSCWDVREQVRKLLDDFQKSPTHVQVKNLEDDVENLKSELALVRMDLETAHQSKAISDSTHEDEYAKLKAKYDKRVHATGTEQVEALKTELRAERDGKHLLEIELADLKEKMRVHLEQHEIAKEGNRALLRFVHTRHRLNVPFDPQSIRGLLQKADEKGNGK